MAPDDVVAGEWTDQPVALVIFPGAQSAQSPKSSSSWLMSV
jgi:hypothetical protein